MSKLHELLAAEKTPTAAWNAMVEDTLKKFKAPTHYFDGHSKSLKMIEDSPANSATEAQAREEKPVTTTVYDTLEYALDLWGRMEDLQYQKNETNRKAVGTVMWKSAPLLVDMPVDELLGLEARLAKIRQVIAEVPTLDATRHWRSDEAVGRHVWVTQHAEETTKTEKTLVPVVLHEATKEHPAQVDKVTKDVVVGKFTLIKRSGSATALQKADALKRVDELLMEVKAARMRANETFVLMGGVADKLLPLLLAPFATSAEDHQ